MIVLGTLPLPGASADEYKVKALFVYNFAKFVEWPEQAFHSAAEPIGVCLLGSNPFGSALEDTLRGQKVGDRVFTIREITEAKQATACHILYVGEGEKKRWRSVAAQIAGASVLTIGEMDGFTASGGIVNFSVKDDRVRIEIDADAAVKAKLRISAKLLSLAQKQR